MIYLISSDLRFFFFSFIIFFAVSSIRSILVHAYNYTYIYVYVFYVLCRFIVYCIYIIFQDYMTTTEMTFLLYQYPHSGTFI